MYDEFMRGFYQFTLCTLALVSFSYLARTMLGPTFFDRILGANNISTIVTVMICILAVEQGEQYLVDVALIYSMLGFVTVVIVCKAYLRSHNMELYSRFRNLPAPVKAERMATHLTTVATVVSHKKEDASVEEVSKDMTLEPLEKHPEEQSSVKESSETTLQETVEEATETVSSEKDDTAEHQPSKVESVNEKSRQEKKEQGGKAQRSEAQEKIQSSQGQSLKKNYPNQKQGKKKKKGGKKS